MTQFFSSLLELLAVFFGFGIISLPLILIITNNDNSVFKKVQKYAEDNGFIYVDKIDFVNMEFPDEEFLDDTDLEINNMKNEIYEQNEEIINKLDGEKRELFESSGAYSLVPARFTSHYEFIDELKKGDINEYTCGLFKLLDNIEVSIFNYNWKPRHYSSSERAGSFGAYIVCILYNKDIAIPEFYLRNSGPIDVLLKTSSCQISEDKDFSNTFTIESPEAAQVKDFLNNRIRNAFLKNNNKNYYYRAKGGCFMVYYPVSFAQYKIEKKTDLLKNALEIFKSMLDNNTEIC